MTGWATREEEPNISQEEHEELRQQVNNLTIERDNRPNTSQTEYNNLLQERDNAHQERNNLQTNLVNEQNARQTAEQQRDQAIIERDNRLDISIEDYNQLINRNQELEDQQITELIFNTNIAGQSREENFLVTTLKISKIKSLKKLFASLCYPCHEWMLNFQNLLTQNNTLTHLKVEINTYREGGSIVWPREHQFDFSKLTKLEFLSIIIPHDTELNLRENKELKILQLRVANCSQSYCQKTTNLDLKENKKLKCLILAGNDIRNLDLSENKDLEYIDVKNTGVCELDLRQNRKITTTSSPQRHKILSLNMLTKIYNIILC